MVQSQGNSTLANLVVNLVADEARAIFEQISGEVHPSMLTVIAEDSRLARNGVLDRLAGEDTGGMWMQVWGQRGQNDGDGNALGLDRDTFGFMMGGEGSIGETGAIGLAGSYTDTKVELDNITRGDGRARS